MSAPVDRRANVATLVYDMEDDVHSLVGWAKAIYDLGAGGSDVDADGLFQIGRAMLAQARMVEEDWNRCFELTRAMRESDR